ncbi:uncharacterized protein LTR77_001536 [Saxophila tyrrhenica]|uniref:Uncharacterized protein n=1 Tax=Saxophila tyrrhenica TaxID=1690608 RepID=A0AAV9PNI5_9PEZI|nr:hypothetical protein LTR77_001536 [Saxophila tyrrhenica]
MHTTPSFDLTRYTGTIGVRRRETLAAEGGTYPAKPHATHRHRQQPHHMPSLIIKPPYEQSGIPSASAAKLSHQADGSPLNNDSNTNATAEEAAPTSPVAPEYSPITPRAQPALPAIYEPQTISGSNDYGQPAPIPTSVARPPSPPPTAEFIPEPAPQPFSGEDATDAIALRAAISSLQFQKKKAQDDIRRLEKIKQKALDEPELFKSELAAGRLQEQRPKIGDLRAILDHEGSDDDDEEVVLGAVADGEDVEMKDAEIPDSQPSRLTSSDPAQARKSSIAPFDRIPGPQNVVRMPYVNWEKYHITGSPLESMHEQQRRWPGNTAYGTDRGREQTVAAPYSPWLDSLDGQGQQRWGRNDSMAVTTPTTAVTPTSADNMHVMETRKKSNQ